MVLLDLHVDGHAQNDATTDLQRRQENVREHLEFPSVTNNHLGFLTQLTSDWLVPLLLALPRASMNHFLAKS